MPRTVTSNTARNIHAATRATRRALRQASEWVTDPEMEANLRRASCLLDELDTYASLRTDAEVPPEQARERLVQFLDRMLEA
jgi:hypothetical protein